MAKDCPDKKYELNNEPVEEEEQDKSNKKAKYNDGEDGVVVKGLSSNDAKNVGDDVMLDEADFNEEEGSDAEDDGKKKKKSKKRRKH